MSMRKFSVKPNEKIKINIFGWDIETSVPCPTGDGQFATPPEPVLLATTNSPMIPPQNISFTTPNPSDTQYLSFTGGDMFKYSDFSGGCWILEGAPLVGGGNANFEIELGSPTAMNLILTISSTKSVISIYVNDKQRVNRYTDTNADWHTQTFQLEGDWFQAGSNTIKIRMSSETVTPLYLQSVEVSTEDVQVSAYYVLIPVGQGEVPTGTTPSVQINVQTGNTTSEANTESFSHTVGVEGGFSYSGISAKLSYSFTYQQSTTHTIAITEMVTVSQAFALRPTKGGENLTYQVWQLAIQFNSGENQLVENQNVFVVTQYPLPN